MSAPAAGGRVTLKLATSLDGRIATGAGESRWITGPEARAQVHRLRAQHDAVLVGAGTALTDDPELTVRLDGYGGPQPARVVLDTRQRLSPESRLARTARAVPVYLVTTQAPSEALSNLGVRILQLPGAGGRPELARVLDALAGRGLGRLFVEGGGQVAAAFLRAGLADALEWFRAPILIGAEGRPGVGDLALPALADAPGFERVEAIPLGRDLWERYRRAGA